MSRPLPVFRIKICGITNSQDAMISLEAGADAIGLNFYPKSSRFVNETLAREIVDAIKFANPDSKRPKPRIVGVFVNSSVNEIQDVIKNTGIDTVQLHGDEPLDLPRQLISALSEDRDSMVNENSVEIEVVKALRLPLDSSAKKHEFEYFSELIDSWGKAGCEAVLLDSHLPGQFGGSGKSLDWELMTHLQTCVPMILAGGLTPDNVRDAITKSGLMGVDVASGVERVAGIKDAEKVRQFVINCPW